jgi:hypothetical protein
MRNCLFTLALAMLVLLPLVGTNSQVTRAPTEEEILRHPVTPVSDVPLPTTQEFVRALVDASVPGGVVTVGGCGAEPEQTVRATGPTLGDVLRTIVKADLRYRWNIEDGVVNLVPSKGLPAMMAMRINEFDSEDATSVLDAGGRIFHLPAVLQAETGLKLTQSPGHQFLTAINLHPSDNEPPPKPLSVHFRDLTLREGLNALVRASGKAVWQYREWHCKGINGFDTHFSEPGSGGG